MQNIHSPSCIKYFYQNKLLGRDDFVKFLLVGRDYFLRWDFNLITPRSGYIYGNSVYLWRTEQSKFLALPFSIVILVDLQIKMNNQKIMK